MLNEILITTQFYMIIKCVGEKEELNIWNSLSAKMSALYKLIAKFKVYWYIVGRYHAVGN